jgi:hypothetical protein
MCDGERGAGKFVDLLSAAIPVTEDAGVAALPHNVKFLCQSASR